MFDPNRLIDLFLKYPRPWNVLDGEFVDKYNKIIDFENISEKDLMNLALSGINNLDVPTKHCESCTCAEQRNNSSETDVTKEEEIDMK